MNDETTSLLDEVIARYLRDEENGQPADRERLLAEHPELAAELEQFFADRDRVSAAVAPVSLPRRKPLATIRYFGDYELLEETACGGMGIVYRARQRSLNRIVAVKMIRGGKFATGDDEKRFVAEAQAAAGLEHEGIVPIYEVGRHDGQHFFSMRYIEGRSLAELVRESPLQARRAATYVRQTAEAIHYAHQRGILHRDLKPSNILVDTNERIQVTDFGLATRVESESELTRTGQVLGTPSYMAPEQAQGKRGLIGPASDVYSLGVVLYELITGRPPFRAETAAETIRQVVETEPASPRLLNLQIPKDLETICLKCLHKEPHRRYPTAEALAEDLGRYLEGRPVLARRVGQVERAWRRFRRNPAVSGALAAAVLCLIVGSAAASYFGIAARAHARAEALERKRADERAAEARRAEYLGRRHLYAAHMSLVQNAWDDGDVGYVLDLLDRWRPVIGEDDLRSFEWFYWHRLCNLHLQTLTAHTEAVTSVTFSPDGTKVVTGSRDGTAKIWDAVTGENLQTLNDLTRWISAVAFSPDGTRIVAGGDVTVIWDTDTGRKLRTLNRVAYDAAFSPDGMRIVTDSGDAAVVWDVLSGEAVQTLRSPEHSVTSVAFCPDGSRIVTGTMEGTVVIWNSATGQKLDLLKGHAGYVEAVAFSPDGARIASASRDETALIWDAASGARLQSLDGHRGHVTTVVFSFDGTRLLSGGRDGVAIMWDAASGLELLRLKGHKSQIESVAFSPDGTRAVTGSDDRTAKIWDALTEGSVQALEPHVKPVTGVAFSPDAALMVTVALDRIAVIRDAVTGKPLRRLNSRADDYFMDVAFSPDGTRLVTGSSSSTARIWNPTTGEPVMTLKGHTKIVRSVAFSPDGTLIVTGSEDKTAKVWDAATGREIYALEGHAEPVMDAVFSPDGTRIVTGSYDKTAKIWNAATGREIVTLDGHRAPIYAVAYSPDGSRLVTGTTIRDAKTGEELQMLKGHTKQVMCIVFSPDGMRIATGSADETAKVCDAITGEPLLKLKDHTLYVKCIAFSPDGRRLVTGSWDHTAKLWPALFGYSGERSLLPAGLF